MNDDDRFMQDLAGTVWADISMPGSPVCESGLSDGRSLTFSHDRVVLHPGSTDDLSLGPGQNVVELDRLLHDRPAAARLSQWLGALFGGKHGVHDRGRFGWTAWAVRGSDQVLEIGVVGYLVFENMEEFEKGERAQGALRRRPGDQKES